VTKLYRIRLVSRKYGTVAWHARRTPSKFTLSVGEASLYAGGEGRKVATRLDESWVGELFDVYLEAAVNYTCPGCGTLVLKRDRRRKGNAQLQVKNEATLVLTDRMAPKVRCRCGKVIILVQGSLT
jgi:hypothetical protein